MKIEEILVESIKPTFTGVYKFANEGASNVANGGYRIKRMDAIIQVIKSAIADGEILNPIMVDVKDVVNKFVDSAYLGCVKLKYTYGGVGEDNPKELQWLEYPSGYSNISACSKKLAKMGADSKKTDCWKAADKLTTELMPLVEVMAYLKTVTVKTSVKRAEAKEASDTYQKKFTDHKDTKKVVVLLKGKAAQIEKELFKNQLNYLTSVVTAYKTQIEAGKSDYKELYKKRAPEYMMVLQRLVKPVRNNSFTFHNTPTEYTLVDDWKELIEKDAKRSASDIVDKFVYKNAAKLSFILYTKNNMKDVVMDNTTVSRGAVEAVLHLTFNDGSEFTADSSVVFAVSNLGTPFYRYPTIFRNVKLPDGKRLTQPSEQRMDEIFAIAK